MDRRTRPGTVRLEVLLPPQLAEEFHATVDRRGARHPCPISWAVREAIAEWCARPDQLVPVDVPTEDGGQLALFDQADAEHG